MTTNLIVITIYTLPRLLFREARFVGPQPCRRIVVSLKWYRTIYVLTGAGCAVYEHSKQGSLKEAAILFALFILAGEALYWIRELQGRIMEWAWGVRHTRLKRFEEQKATSE
jgi:hypothetical protein